MPDDMIGMNGNFYSFKNGKLYKHHDNETRNNFYGEQYNSSITGIFNVEPSTIKTFKTLFLESDASWKADVLTDLHEGFIESEWFELKEGDYFAFIRRRNNDGNYNMRSAQGLGRLKEVNGSEILFPFDIDSILSVGDVLFHYDGNDSLVVGTITSKPSSNTIVIDDSNSETSVSNGDYVFYVKNSTSESSGATGYFMEFTIENDNTDRVEIFSVGSSIFKSFP
jgi:hypothetical protein